MSIQFDEKGKIFTNVIPKRPIPVIIQSTTHRIHGDLHVRPDDRIKDELNRCDDFIAITCAVVYDEAGQQIFRSDFLTINRDQIIWLIPNEDLIEDELSGGPA